MATTPVTAKAAKDAARQRLLEGGLCEEIAELVKAIDRLEARWEARDMTPGAGPEAVRAVFRARDAYLATWLEDDRG